MNLTIEQFLDLAKTTLTKYPAKKRAVDLSHDLRDVPIAKRLIPKLTTSQDSDGVSLSWLVRVRPQASAAWRHPTETDGSLNIPSGFERASINWRFGDYRYGFYKHEEALNQGSNAIVDLINSRRDSALEEWMVLVNRTFWGFTAATNSRAPFGIPNYVVKSASTADFNGGHPTGYSDVAGLSSTTYTRHKNWAGPYTLVTLDDLVAKIRDMAKKTKFMPLGKTNTDLVTGMDREYWTNLDVETALEDLQDTRHDNVQGFDLAYADGKTVIRGTTVQTDPTLDEDTTDPFYQLDLADIELVSKDGWMQKETKLDSWWNNHNQVGVIGDTMCQMRLKKRRSHGVLSTGTTQPIEN